jgi:hypothetical protein
MNTYMRNLNDADCKSTETFGCMSRGERIEVLAKGDDMGKDGIGGISTLQTGGSA